MFLFLKFIVFFLLDLAVMLLGKLFAPIIARNVGEDWNIQNQFLKLICQTPDSLMNGGGVNGDRTYNKKLGYTGGDETFYKANLGKPIHQVARGWQWQNTTQGFSTWALGARQTNRTIKEKPFGRGYWKTSTCNETGKVLAFELKIDIKYPFIEKRFVIRSGHKIGWNKNFPDQFAGISLRPWQSM